MAAMNKPRPPSQPLPSARPGGRSARVRSAVLDATWSLLIEGGAESLSMEKIAERAQVHKTTLYRRWGELGVLVREAIGELENAQVQLPDTGSLRGDLLGLLHSFAEHFESPKGRAINRLIAGSRDRGQLGEWIDQYWHEHGGQYRAIIERAVQRGELSGDSGYQRAIEISLGPLLLRSLMTDQAIDDALIQDLADATESYLQGLSASGRDT